ncbi:hypothetical protein QBC43DRAFT_316818 [Cladorrhinum sp. PSN259]|nr:hypothetical protein QBC43DRAFT_316818 [Cladorrhinum sp. PSN259]
MSLGVAQLCRARPVAALMPQWLPREFALASACAAALRRHEHHQQLNLLIRRSYSSSKGINNNNNNKIPEGSTATSSWEEISRNEDIAAAIEAAGRKPAPSTLVGRLEDIPVRKHGSQSILIKPLTRYEGFLETREDLQRYHRAMKQQERLNERLDDPNPPDWRAVIEFLMEWTPVHDPERIRAKVLLPEYSQGHLLRISDAIWDIPARTGCEMIMAPVPSKTNQEGEEGEQGGGEANSTCLWLSGRSTELDKALKEILAVTKQMTVIRLSDTGDEEAVLKDAQQQGIERARPDEETHEFEGWRHSRGGRAAMQFAPADLIKLRTKKVLDSLSGMQRPRVWTKQNFLDWVIHLTSSKADKNFQRLVYEPGRRGAHHPRILTELREVFFDPISSRKASNPALKVALKHLASHGVSHVNLCHELFDRAKELGIKMDTKIWNILLETSVKSKDMLGFKSRLKRMVAAGFVPSLSTWLLFLRMVEAEEVKRYVIQGIHLKGYLASPWAVQRVSNEMADTDAYRAGRLGLTWEEHLQGLKDLYGPEWYFPVSSANKTISQYVRNNKFDEAVKVLEYMFFVKEHDYQKPNSVTLCTLLGSCETQRRAGLALKVLKVFERERRLNAVLNETALHHLFEIAWKKRKPHFLAAVWRYAHLVNLVGDRMRFRGMNLLQGGEAVDRFKIPWHEGATQKQVMDALLLWDYKQEGWDTAEEEAQVREEQEAKEEAAPAPPVSQATEEIPKPSAMKAAESEIVSILATPEKEQPAAMSGGDVPAENLPKFSPRIVPHQVMERYRGFEEWSMGRYLIGAPGVPLSKFLEQAMELDREWYGDEKEREAATATEVKGYKFDELAPPELPVKLRKREDQIELLKKMRRAGVRDTESQRFKAILKVAEGAAGF